MTTPGKNEGDPLPQEAPVEQGPDFSDLVRRVYNTSDDSSLEDEETSPAPNKKRERTAWPEG